MASGEGVAPMRWWGWGDPGHPPGLPAHALAFLRETVGVAPRSCPPVALAHVQLPSPSLPAGALAELRSLLGEEAVRETHAERVGHAAGRGYPDLVRLRAGTPKGAPDAVVYPSDARRLRALLELCGRRSLALVPFGGGTSVVGGVAPLRGAHAGVLSLDMRRLDALVELDRESRIATVQAGMRAPALERLLGAQGLTLGHFPQSYEHVSLGGCAATRSAGQASTGYGRFEQLVLGLRLAAPAGELELPALPASAAGPQLRELALGSEGMLGVIHELALRVRPAPTYRRYEGVFFTDFASGTQALRALAQERLAPAVTRLSDEQETRMSLALAGGGGLKGRLGRAYLGARGYGGGCLAILGFEGAAVDVEGRRARALALVRAHGGLPVGRSPGEAWRAQRFVAPYLRDDLLTHGVLVETLETATRWSRLGELYREVGRAIAGALEKQGTPGLVMCHVSHVYETGASLYFTFLARQREGHELEQWQAVKRAAGDAIAAHGGTITHHHAVGCAHTPWLEREIGESGVQALRALKAELDPTGIMNPGKLLPA
ncbi:MAG TPA: FAD-binding oxidoreductase [Solirubrobacteraceae bacterium]|nr:FAD-binding oxidoreductase [Solirubrobacteraceae bacterium]